MTDWLQELKEGDKVIRTGTRGLPDKVLKVTRTTKTQIACASESLAGQSNEIKFRKSNGYWFGNSQWGSNKIERWTQEKKIR